MLKPIKEIIYEKLLLNKYCCNKIANHHIFNEKDLKILLFD
jgi:hypothetical protein